MLSNAIKSVIRDPGWIPKPARRAAAGLLVLGGRVTSAWRALPSFLIIGAQRGGTTALHSLLIQHPDVRPGYRKEVHYFSSERNYRKGMGWYRSHFPMSRRGDAGWVTCEATPEYLWCPAAPDRVRRDLPEVRLIVLLRDPVARAYSGYQRRARIGKERLSFEDAIRRDPEDPASYLARGLYLAQLERWWAHFPEDRILVRRSEDFFADAAGVLREIARFLGLPAWDDPPKLNRRYNAVEYEDMSPAARDYAAEFYREPNRKLAERLGDDFTW